MTDTPERRDALLRLLAGPVRATHPDFDHGAEIRAMFEAGLIRWIAPLPPTLAYRIELTPAGLAAARAVKGEAT